MKASNRAVQAFAVALIAGLLLALLVPFATRSSRASTSGRSYYVDPNGSDSNSGADASVPFKTIQKAVDLAQPGDVINLAPGTYFQDILSKRNGTASAPITITGPSGAVIKGGGNARIVEINHDYLTLDGFTIDGLWGAPTSMSGYRDKLLYALGKAPLDGVSGLKLLHMTFKNAGGECVRFRYFAQSNEVAFSTILNCGNYDFKFNAGGKNGEGIYIGTAPEQRGDGKNPTTDPDQSSKNWIHDNTFDTEGNECVDIKEAAAGNIVEHNRCTGQKDPESGGFDARGSANIFRYNESFGNSGSGVRLGGDTSVDGINNDVYANSIHDNGAGGIKFQRVPQGKVCGNTMSNNVGGNSVGSYAGQINATIACADPVPSATSTPVPNPTGTPVPNPTSTPVPNPTSTPVPNPNPSLPGCGAYTVAGNTTTAIEAELYASLSGRFARIADGSRSGGAYMQIPGRGMAQDPNTFLSFDLSVSGGGAFYVWLLGTGADSSSDSFFLQLDAAAPVQANLIQGHWGWKKVGTTLQIGDGLHSFKVKNRENGANIDKIILTKDKSFVPTGLGVSALAPQCH